MLNCPKCGGEMAACEKGVLEDSYLCKGCGERLAKRTGTGEILAIVGGLATVAAVFFGLSK